MTATIDNMRTSLAAKEVEEAIVELVCAALDARMARDTRHAVEVAIGIAEDLGIIDREEGDDMLADDMTLARLAARAKLR